MLLWSLHPKYLDTKGLGAAWFEGLIARSTLTGKTEGWKHHPQLLRFKNQPDPVAAIDSYLEPVYREGIRRGFRYNPELFNPAAPPVRMAVSRTQLEAEYGRLLEKLKRRNPEKYDAIKDLKQVEPHPMFDVLPSVMPQSVKTEKQP